MANDQVDSTVAVERAGQCVDEVVGCWADLAFSGGGDRRHAARRLAAAAIRLLHVAQAESRLAPSAEPVAPLCAGRAQW